MLFWKFLLGEKESELDWVCTQTSDTNHTTDSHPGLLLLPASSVPFNRVFFSLPVRSFFSLFLSVRDSQHHLVKKDPCLHSFSIKANYSVRSRLFLVIRFLFSVVVIFFELDRQQEKRSEYRELVFSEYFFFNAKKSPSGNSITVKTKACSALFSLFGGTILNAKAQKRRRERESQLIDSKIKGQSIGCSQNEVS